MPRLTTEDAENNIYCAADLRGFSRIGFRFFAVSATIRDDPRLNRCHVSRLELFERFEPLEPFEKFPQRRLNFHR